MIRPQFVDMAKDLFEKGADPESTMVALATAKEGEATLGELHCICLGAVAKGNLSGLVKFAVEKRGDPKFEPVMNFFKTSLARGPKATPGQAVDPAVAQAQFQEGSKAFVEALADKLDDAQKSLCQVH